MGLILLNMSTNLGDHDRNTQAWETAQYVQPEVILCSWKNFPPEVAFWLHVEADKEKILTHYSNLWII